MALPKLPNITRTNIHIEGVEHHMRHSSPILLGMREFEVDPSPHPPWMNWCQLCHCLWTSVGYRGFQGSGDIRFWVISKNMVFVFASNLHRIKRLSVWVLFSSSPWQQGLSIYLPSGDFCSPARFSLFCWPSVKIRHWQTCLVLQKHWALTEAAFSTAYQNLLANGALCWVLRLTAVQQTACNMTHCKHSKIIWMWGEKIPKYCHCSKA